MKQILSISLFSATIFWASSCPTTEGEHMPPPQEQGTVNYTSGSLISSPSAKEIEEALSLGKRAQNNSLLDDAYTISWKNSSIDKSIKIVVETPIYRIAEHARKRAQEFRRIDNNYIKSICQRGTITLSAADDSAINSRTLNQKALLIRDGIRIEPVSRLSLSYSIEEISKPGNYAIVIRDPAEVIATSLKEIKIPISFEDFR